MDFLSATPGWYQIQTSSHADIERLLLEVLFAGKRQVVLCVETQKDLARWVSFCQKSVEQISDFRVFALPYGAYWGLDRFVNPTLMTMQRMAALSALHQITPCVIVTTPMALFSHTVAAEDLRKNICVVQTGMTLDQDDFLTRLTDLGYLRSDTVDEEGTYALRGGMIDVFSPYDQEGCRIEWDGDTVTQMRRFDPVTQKSTQHIKEAFIIPCTECLIPRLEWPKIAQSTYEKLLDMPVVPADREGFSTALMRGSKPSHFELLTPLFRPASSRVIDHMRPENFLVLPESWTQALRTTKEWWQSVQRAYEQDVEDKKLTVPPTLHFAAESCFAFAAQKDFAFPVLEIGEPSVRPGARAMEKLFPTDQAALLADPLPQKIPGLSQVDVFNRWAEWLEKVQQTEKVVILGPSVEHFDRITHLLGGRHLPFRVEENFLAQAFAGATAKSNDVSLILSLGHFDAAFFDSARHLFVVPLHELVGSQPKEMAQRKAARKLRGLLSSLSDLSIGDYVVFIDHGIGRYKGLVSMTVRDVTQDFLLIEYAGNDKIYLPVDRLSALQKYAGDMSTVSVDRLGTTAWEKRKERVKKSILELADKLIRLQAERALVKTKPYPSPPEAFYGFEEEFPYEETPDQLKALKDLEDDLTSGKLLDRLICGDVGFGKTEIALRATMRFVLEGQQVLILVPTTVLCYQHYRTFLQRMAKHGVRIAQINRFVDGKTVKKTLEDFSRGLVDVLIGTHRLLTSDVKPKSLGAVIVDEEQRFGVTHKEKLKELRAGVHLLTMTATPIPRTLHMAMLGLKDISIIATPPVDRLSVKTYIAEADESLIRNAITREVQRGGQVFYVSNRVETIREKKAWLESFLPEISIRVGHGQMDDQTLEDLILDFIEHKFQVLLCTTIIESGVDMPNVNTLIVDDADRFGLAQMYQLRGRVGRSHAQGYAYFLVDDLEKITDDARSRLEVLTRHQELGAGFQIASFDLELRGAGNLLGDAQSGHVREVGLDLYTQMLEEAMQELQGAKKKSHLDTEMKLHILAHIPESYIPSESQRLQTYRQLFGVENFDEMIDQKQLLRDRYGAFPAEVELLFQLAQAKLLLRDLGATVIEYKVSSEGYEIKLGAMTETKIDHLIKLVQSAPQTYRLTPDYRVLVQEKASFKSLLEQKETMQLLLFHLEKLNSPAVL